MRTISHNYASYSLCVLLVISELMVMLVEDARGDHMEEVYSRAGLMTAL